MQSSSLIFLVIIGVWAAFLAQVWVRRREHLHTARSVDALTETMRLLHQRPAVPTSSSTPTRSYAVSPARAARPTVTLSATRTDALASARVVAMARTASAGRPVPSPGTAPAARTAPLAPPAGGPGSPLPAGSRAGAARTGGSRPVGGPAVRMRPGRSVRGLALLTLVLGTFVFGILAALGVLRTWSPVVPLGAAFGAFAWLRSGVQAEMRARRAARDAAHGIRAARAVSRRGPAAERTRVDAGSRTGPAAATPATPAPAGSSDDRRPAASADILPAATPLVVDPSPAPYDIAAVEEVAAARAPRPSSRPAAPSSPRTAALAPAVPEVDEDDIPLTWDPRPVPRPTYTMKAPAYRRPVEEPALTQGEPDTAGERPAYDRPRRVAGH